MKKLILLLLLFAFAACGESYSPKPRGYFRIDLPGKSYQQFDSVFPYSFEYPAYARFVADTRKTAEPYWGNLEFPQFKGVLHLSYKPIRSPKDLEGYSEDAHTFVNRHIPKATAINPHMVYIPANRVYGIFHEIRGREAASPIQFYVTDSLDHFLRGALYFEVTPNNDSLAPVIEFIEEDILHLISTLQWERRR